MNITNVGGSCPIPLNVGEDFSPLPASCSSMLPLVAGMTAGFIEHVVSGSSSQLLRSCHGTILDYLTKQCVAFSTSVLGVSKARVLSESNEGTFPLTVVGGDYVVFRIWDTPKHVSSDYRIRPQKYVDEFKEMAAMVLLLWHNLYIATVHTLEEERIITELAFDLCNDNTDPVEVYFEGHYQDKKIYENHFSRMFTDTLSPNHACIGLEDIGTQASFEIAQSYLQLDLYGDNDPSLLENLLQRFVNFLEFDAYLNSLWEGISQRETFHKVMDLYKIIESIRSFKQDDVPDELTFIFMKNVESQFKKNRRLFLRQAKTIFRYLLATIKHRFVTGSPAYNALDVFYKTCQNEPRKAKKEQLLIDFLRLFRGQITTAGWRYGPGIVIAGAAHIPGINVTDIDK